jgi:hypothetical protein
MRGIVGIVEEKLFAAIRPVIMEPAILASPVLVSKHLCMIEYHL